MPFEFLIIDLPDLQKSIGTDKGLAKIGDNVVNLSYSLAKSIHLTKNNLQNKTVRTGLKVNKTILANALKNADMKKTFAKTRADAHDLADTVEALIAYVWISNKMTLNEIVSFLTEHLAGDLTIRSQEIEKATKAFTNLLIYMKKFLPDK